MNEFVEECRREWQLLGVPDPIANEMALDLTTDIEEAEAEGGSAEDVLGSSLFDPRAFAAAWASARGVTAQSVPSAPSSPFVSSAPTSPPRTPALLDRFSSKRWPLVAGSMAILTVLVAIIVAAGAFLVVGRNSSAVAAPVRGILRLPGSSHLFIPGPATRPARNLMPGQLCSRSTTTVDSEVSASTSGRPSAVAKSNSPCSETRCTPGRSMTNMLNSGNTRNALPGVAVKPAQLSSRYTPNAPIRP